MAAPSSEKPHTERWAYRLLYTDNIFAFTTKLYPFLGRLGFQIVSRSVAWVYAVTQPAIRRIVRENLSLLQKHPASDWDAIRVFVNYGATLADYVAVGAMPTEKALALCVNQETGLDNIREATRDGRGVILATAHYSFFEFGTVIMGTMGLPLTVVTLPEPNPPLTAWRANWRKRWQGETVEIGSDPFSSLQVIRALDQGRCMAMLADRPLPEHGLPVDLPNGRISFSTSPALLSAMTGCSVVPVVVVRNSDGLYELIAKPPITARPASRADRKNEIEACTRAIAASLFEEVSRAPKQWYQFVPVGL